MNEQQKKEITKEIKEMLMERYNKGFEDCEAAAKLAMDAAIVKAILMEREACAKLCESYVGATFDMCANAIRARWQK